MITEDNTLRVMRLFFEGPEKQFHIRQIARLTGISSTGIIKIVKKLKAQGILKSRKERMVEAVEADFEGRFPHLKRAYNLISLYDCGLVKALRDFFEEPKTIILFGSYAEGADISRSDIDIAIITQKDELPNMEKFEKRLHRRIKLITLTLDKAAAEFKNSLANGIVLSGYLEIK